MPIHDTAPHTAVRRAGRTLLGVLVVLVSLFVFAAPAAAHTDFESSDPADGSVVSEPVDTVTLTFTGAASSVSDGFVALTPTGELQAPIEILAVDDRTFELRFDPPLAGGAVGVRWSVAAGDSHRIDGAFSFTVDAPAPTTTTSVPPTTAAPTTVPEPVESSDPAESSTVTGDSSTPEPPAAGATESDATDLATVDGVADSTETTSAEQDQLVTTLEDFLTTDAAAPGEGIATTGRTLGFVGVVLAIGGLAFAATTLRGARSEIGAVLVAIRVAGAATAVGAMIEYVGVARLLDRSLGDAWSTSGGTATVLRMLGGAAIAVGIVATIRTVRSSSARSLSAMVADQQITDGPDASHDEAEALSRWSPRSSLVAGVGVALVVVSFWFDGHTVTEGFRPLHAAINSVHVVAGSIWVGGVTLLAVLAWWRGRAGRVTGVSAMFIRFSSIATVALAAVLVGGAVMAVSILDSPSELTGTEWGRTLLVKSGVVAVAIAMGAYNHVRLRPTLEADPTSGVAVTMRRTLAVEAAVLLSVVVITAWLVVAAI